MIDDRPRGQLFRDPSARVVWAGICALDEASQHDVLEQLRVRLANADTRKGEHNQKRARAIAALRAAATRLGGRSPSVIEYRRFLQSNPDLGWPADGTVRRWLGGDWNSALKQAHLDAVPEPLAVQPALGSHFSEQELLGSLRDCATDLGKSFSFPDYLSWARRRDVTARSGRRPRSIGPFQRVFGGWRPAMRAAGLRTDHVQGYFTNGSGNMFSDEDMVKALREVVERIGRFPTMTEYSAERTRILKERDQVGARGAFPNHGALLNRFGSWPSTHDAYQEAERA